jgi:hypothetical protein
MSQKLKYSGNLCSSGVLVSFSGLNLSLEDTYKIIFNNVGSFPSGNTNVIFNPTGYILSPSEPSPIVQTLFRANSNMSDNSSLNLIGLSIYNSQNQLIYTEYKSIACENLCGPGVPIPPTPTPTNTPTMTPTITPTITTTPTPTPTPPPPPLAIVASWDRYINKLGNCSNVTIRAKAYGVIGQTYNYQFNTDMNGVDLNISNPSGVITIFENPTYVYTAISLPASCQNYTLEFGISDGFNTVQSVGVFRCGNC